MQSLCELLALFGQEPSGVRARRLLYRSDPWKINKVAINADGLCWLASLIHSPKPKKDGLFGQSNTEKTAVSKTGRSAGVTIEIPEEKRKYNANRDFFGSNS